MKNKLFVASFILIAFFISSCQNSGTTENKISGEKTMVNDVVTSEIQSSLTPDEVINDFKVGNKRYVENNLTNWDFSSKVRKTADGQYPKAIVLSCVDSRVPVEYVLDQGVGDIFVARVAGNFVNEDILGSMEFACKVSGSKVIMVMGHESCGAVKAAIDNVKLGNITPMLTKIEPAVKMSQNFEGEKSTKNPAFVSHVCENNVNNTIETIRANSPILKEMEENGEIKIVGAVYSLSTGKVDFL
jgi:carbonic anhydrase